MSIVYVPSAAVTKVIFRFPSYFKMTKKKKQQKKEKRKDRN